MPTNTTIAYTDTVLNYSGMLSSKVDNNTRLLDSIYSIGRTIDTYSIGRRKVNSINFTLSSSYATPVGSQPSISESASGIAPTAISVTRDQQDNIIQIFQKSVQVSYMKQSANGEMAGLNISNQSNNVPNELDFQASQQLLSVKKDLNYTYINGVYAKATSNTVAGKSRGIIAGITSNAATGNSFDKNTINSAITAAMANGFDFNDGKMTLWVNPSDLTLIDTAYTTNDGYNQPASRTDGGYAIRTIITQYGMINVDYDKDIPVGTMLLLNMSELAVAELDVPNKGNFFYESLAKTGAAEKGQIYGQASPDYGAEWKHIKITITSV